VIWDTQAPVAGTTEAPDRAGWKQVPSELLTLEADPPKAASDPGYYGREYSFKGDAVLENQHVWIVISSARGRLVVFGKTNPLLSSGASKETAGPGRKLLELGPPKSPGISRCVLVRNAGDEAVVEVFFSADKSPEISAVVTLGKTEVLEVKPSRGLPRIELRSEMECGIVPGFLGDDLLFDAAAVGATPQCIPSENCFVSLLRGEENMVVMTWPKGAQRMRLETRAESKEWPIEFDNDGQAFYLAALSAPGIWHREPLKAAYLEKETGIQWKKPFAAKWKTQLDEAGVKTTFGFREAKGEIWRGVPGSYKYPVWFNGPNAFYHLSKKVPPKGDSIIYFLEGQDTPSWVASPVDILKSTLGRQAADAILDVSGRKLRTHHRRGGDGVRRACTCGCTEMIQAVFTAGEEESRKEDIAGALDDMVYFVQHHVARIDEYRKFAGELTDFLQAKQRPELSAYIDALKPIVQQIPQEYSVQKENMGSSELAQRLTRETLALAAKKDSGNLKAYMDLLKAWRAMGGAQDYVLAQYHRIARSLCQEAGYRCVDQPQAAVLAEEIRARCRAILRNPDGYEIWADY